MEQPMPSRPSVLHRELADQANAPDQPPAADPWSAWHRLSAGEAGPLPAADPGEDS